MWLSCLTHVHAGALPGSNYRSLMSSPMRWIT
jgi:hypothetical protein